MMKMKMIVMVMMMMMMMILMMMMKTQFDLLELPHRAMIMITMMNEAVIVGWTVVVVRMIWFDGPSYEGALDLDED